MHRQVVCLVILDQVLWLFLRSMNRVTLECDFGGMLFPDRPAAPVPLPSSIQRGRRL